MLAAVEATGSHKLNKLGYSFVNAYSSTPRRVEVCQVVRGFDLDAKIWTIPAERMKMRKVHTVPLTSQVLVLLDEVRAINGDGVGACWSQSR